MAIQTVCEAVRDLLFTVDGVSKIADRPGGVPVWLARRQPLHSYWEVDVIAVEEAPAAAPREVDDTYVVRIEGWMPWGFGNVSPNSAATWRPLLDAVREILRENQTLGGVVDDTPFGTDGLPQLLTNERAGYEDGEKEVLCHHAVLEMRYIVSFSYTTV